VNKPKGIRENARHAANNRKSNHRITLNGETLSIADWSRRSGIHQDNISSRLIRGWSPEKAVFKPARKLRRN
jgi:hypothetical protein